jgi:hypothetical protein
MLNYKRHQIDLATTAEVELKEKFLDFIDLGGGGDVIHEVGDDVYVSTTAFALIDKMNEVQKRHGSSYVLEVIIEGDHYFFVDVSFLAIADRIGYVKG